MKASKFKYVFGTIGIGLLVNALWSMAYDHIFPGITRYYINLVSKFSNIVFVNISSHDLNSINQSTNFLLTFLIVVAALILYGWSYFKMQNAKEHFEYAENRFLKKNEKPLENDNEYSEEDFLKSIEKSNKLFKKLYLFNMLLLPAVLIGFLIINIGSAITSRYIHESITYFDYLLYLNAENLDDKTERKYKSEFSQIRSSQDYHKLILELEKLALSNDLSISPNLSVRSKEELAKDHPNLREIPIK